MSGSGGGGMSNLRRQASMLKLLGGEVYTEHYQQKKELGRGKFGVVYQVNRYEGYEPLIVVVAMLLRKFC